MNAAGRSLVFRNRYGSRQQISFSEGDTVLDALRKGGLVFVAPCAGRGTCGKCSVLIWREHKTSRKLACQTIAKSDMVISIEELDQIAVEGIGACPSEEKSTLLSNADNAKAELGLAVDIGTTTIAAFLVDLRTRFVWKSAGRANPQAPYGADVMSRIRAACAQNSLDTLCAALVSCVSDMGIELCDSLGIPTSRVSCVSVVGNTAMEHFAAGLNPEPLGTAPFVPRSLFGEAFPFPLSGGLPQQAYLGPAIAGFVGADVSAGALAAGLPEEKKTCLYIDIGTNGEIVLQREGRITCCSTAAGPAFEGAGIEFGMPALPGAICSVQYETGRLLVNTIGDSLPVGICGSGLLDAIACLLSYGIIDETGRVAENGSSSTLRTEAWKGQAAWFADDARSICVTQHDVREFQLAKAAIRAGIETLFLTEGIACEDIDELLLAGGFGSQMRPSSAARVGLIPYKLLQKTRACGNAAGAGAVALLFPEGRIAAERLARSTAHIELSGNALFSKCYVEAMGFDEQETYNDVHRCR